MLVAQGIVSAADGAAIAQGLDEIWGEIESGRFKFSRALEDIHMNVESRLREIIGDPAGRLHTGRSRNDQVALDMKLWTRGAIDDLEVELKALQARSEEHTSELQSLMRNSYAVFCLQKKK